jgi:hypothetical protein
VTVPGATSPRLRPERADLAAQIATDIAEYRPRPDVRSEQLPHLSNGRDTAKWIPAKPFLNAGRLQRAEGRNRFAP